MSPAKHILIIDDEPNVRLMFRTALESAGHEVVESEGGEQGLRRLRQSPADLVLLDLQMPTMDGLEVLRRLRSDENLVPVVIITAYGSVPDAVEAMKLGAIDFLAKPITPDALRKVVVQILESPGGRPPRGALPESGTGCQRERVRRESPAGQTGAEPPRFPGGRILPPRGLRPR